MKFSSCVFALLFPISIATAKSPDKTDARLVFLPLAVNSTSFRELGLSFEEMQSLNREIQEKLRPQIPRDNSRRLNSRLFGPPENKETASKPPADVPVLWPQTRALIEEKLTPAKRILHEQYTFQHCIGIGMPLSAMRYVGVKLSEKQIDQIETARNAMLPQVNAQLRSDRMELEIELLASVMDREELKSAVGIPYQFQLPVLQKSVHQEDGTPNLQLLSVLRSPFVQAELKCTVKQVRQIREFDKKVRREHGLQDSSPEDPEGIPDEEMESEQLDLIHRQIKDGLAEILDNSQVTRLREIVLQRYLASGETKLAADALGISWRELSRSPKFMHQRRALGSDLSVARHLRMFKMFSPMVVEQMDEHDFAKLTKKMYLPVDVHGVDATFAAPFFADLMARDVVESTNPRRRDRER